MDPTLTRIVLDDGLEQFFEQSLSLPGLKPLMQHTAGNTKPFFFNGFPLATGPQNMPDAIHYIPVRHRWTTGSNFFGSLGQVLFQQFPKLAWHSVMTIRFCAILCHGDVTFRTGVVVNPVLSGLVSFFNYFSDRYLCHFDPFSFDVRIEWKK